MSARFIAAAAATLATGCAPPAATGIAQPAAPAGWATACEDWDGWDKPGPPFRIHGTSYYVGTCGIGAILIAGESGHVLIDSGTEAGAREVLRNIRALGFDPQDVTHILTSHEHFDHVGGLALLQAATGAAIATSVDAAPVIRSGMADPRDPQHGMHAAMAPASVARTVAQGDTLSLGGLTFTAVATPGHTPGALSWHWRSCDEAGTCRTIVYADSLSPVSSEGYRFSDHPDYVAAYRAGLARLGALDCDILLTPHPSASGMRDKLLAGDMSTGPHCADYAESITARLDARLAEEAEGNS